MTFVFPVLLGSLALIGIPVLIHLIMRKKPRTLPFPAFRFLLQRQRINVRRLRLRHLVLLALRILLLGCIGLALARPQVFYQGFSLRGDRPVAVVMIFDTSFTMQYKTKGVSRLEQAKKHGLELIDQLPSGSRVAILDTADLTSAGKTPWLQAMNQARERIGQLQWKPANAPVSQRLESAYRILADLAQDRDDDRARQLPRLVVIFSDRTRASWDVRRADRLRMAADQVPPLTSGVQQARADLPNLIDLLGELRDQLPPEPGKDYPQQELLNNLAQLKELLPRLTAEDPSSNPEIIKAMDTVRRRSREIITVVSQMKDRPDAATEYKEKLLTALHTMLRDLSGARVFFIDVGIDLPIDLTLLDLALPRPDGRTVRQVFGENEKVLLKAHVLATGKDASTSLRLQVGKKTIQKNIDARAGQVLVVPFELDCRELGLGQHSAEVHLATEDVLPGNNSRYVTFAVRQPRRVLVLADDPAKADEFAGALADNLFVPEVLRPQDRPTTANLLRYQAVYLHALANPTESLWAELEQYVNKGGGVGVIPGGAEMKLDAYNRGPAQNILPGTWRMRVTQKDKPAHWNFKQPSVFQHPLLRPLMDDVKNPNLHFILHPSEATQYWDVQPLAKEMVLVSYDDDKARPALLERQADLKQDRPGRVLMFTTTLDVRKPPWNNYLENISSFYPVIIGLATNYLANEVELAQLNFVCGQEDPFVPLPPSPRFPAYLLQGPDTLEQVQVPAGANNLVLKQAVYPGNYSLSSVPPNEGKFTARFSLNLPADESNLSRIPVSELEAVLGQGSVLAGQETASLHDIMQGQWSDPVEMFPSLMVLILLALALENLLANRFYKREPS